MKKFNLRILLFTAPLVFIFLLAEFIFDDSLLAGSSRIFKKVHEYLENKNDVRILVFGNSHGDNAISEDFEPDIFNLANQGQDLKYDWFLFDFIGDIDKVDFVVLTLSFFSFEYSEDKIWPYQVKDYMDLHTLNPTGNILQFRRWVYDNSILINHTMSTNNLVNYIKKKYFRKPEKKKKNIKKGRIDFQKKRKTLIQDAERRAVPTQLKYFNAPFKTNQAYINHFIKKCQQAKKHLVLMVPPFHSTLIDRFDPVKLNDFYEKMSQLENEHNLPVFDYSKDVRFLNNDAYFLNSDHLNKEGARYFTEIFLGDLKTKFDINEYK